MTNQGRREAGGLLELSVEVVTFAEDPSQEPMHEHGVTGDGPGDHRGRGAPLEHLVEPIWVAAGVNAQDAGEWVPPAATT